MTLGYDDVMFLLRLLLGTGQRILLEVQAVEPLRLAGAAGEGGGREGKQSHAELLLPQPSLHTPRAFYRRDPGDRPVPSDLQGRAALVRGRGREPPFPTGENTEPAARHTGSGGEGPAFSAGRHTPHAHPQAGRAAAASSTADSSALPARGRGVCFQAAAHTCPVYSVYSAGLSVRREQEGGAVGQTPHPLTCCP